MGALPAGVPPARVLYSESRSVYGTDSVGDPKTAVQPGPAVETALDCLRAPGVAWTIHVYGGDFFGAARSEWDPATLEERPYDVARARQVFKDANDRWLAKAGSTARRSFADVASARATTALALP